MQSSALFKRSLVLESLLHPAAWSMDRPAPVFCLCHDISKKFWRLADFRRINGSEKTSRKIERMPIVGRRKTEKVTGEI
jgi:hypothetical protein